MCCSTSSTPIPVSSATLRMIGSSRSTMIGARPRLISSTISTFGVATMARATASICCSPPDSKPGPPVHQRAQGGQQRQGPLHARSLVLARAAQPELQVLGDGEPEEQRAVLRHVAQAPPGHLVRGAERDRRTEHVRGAVEAP